MQMTHATSSGASSPFATPPSTSLPSHETTNRSTHALHEPLGSNPTPRHSLTTIPPLPTHWPRDPSLFTSPLESPTLLPTRTATPQQPSTPRSSLSLRSIASRAPRTPSTRPRGKSAPSPQTPDANGHGNAHAPDRDSDSVLSFTPSMSGKNISTWFSGLLGR